jgi:hypothetical protein
VKGISFWQGFENGARIYFSKEEAQFPDLPAQRYLHQMVVLNIGGQPHLLVMGGKERPYDALSLNTAFKLNIKECLGTKSGKVINTGSVWEECAPMAEARCMFAATVVKNRFVYVFGGTKEAV